MRENRLSGSEGGARFYPSFLPLSAVLSVKYHQPHHQPRR